MNIYQPYEVLADTEDCLHLKETETRERIHFVVFLCCRYFSCS